jgi:Mycothiol maleylpyruvate isomerase N-terminal domain
MKEPDVDRGLVAEWQALVAAGRPDRDLAVAILETHGSRITRPLLWAELEDVRLEFVDLRASIDEASKAERLATTLWTVKDVVGHVAAWATEFANQMETIAARKEFDYLITFTPRVGPTEWNDRALAPRAAMSLGERFDELDAATSHIQDLALSLPDDVLFSEALLPETPDGRPENRWRSRVADMMLMMCMHDRYHLERLREVLP